MMLKSLLAQELPRRITSEPQHKLVRHYYTTNHMGYFKGMYNVMQLSVSCNVVAMGLHKPALGN